MNEHTKRVNRLFGELAAVAERGGYSYQETTEALAQLSKYYAEIGRAFLNGADMMKIARYKQDQYEKSAATLSESAAAEIT